MAFNYLVHAQHIGAGDNVLNVPYHLSSPKAIDSTPKHVQELLALIAIQGGDSSRYEIQCDSMGIEVDKINSYESIPHGNYEIYSDHCCEYITISKISPIGPLELSEINNYISCEDIELTVAQANHLIP